ncbi:MAG: YkgJ family cysteine cluster protein [Armatimonadetes bacterium]|nr:YkgJ family cysteine cluster protein [Armatimonadota bacterium]
MKTRLNLSNAELDAIVEETTDTVWKQIDCTTCANCCRTLQIVVDDKDISRLSAHLGTTPSEFSRRYVQIGKDKTKYFTKIPCPFLGEDNRCTVYEARPQACSGYPYLHWKGFRTHSLMMLDGCSTCPIVFNVWHALKQRLQPPKR